LDETMSGGCRVSVVTPDIIDSSFCQMNRDVIALSQMDRA
jgi:hypothetical protein